MMGRKAEVRIKRKLFRTLSGSIAFVLFLEILGTVGAIDRPAGSRQSRQNENGVK